MSDNNKEKLTAESNGEESSARLAGWADLRDGLTQAIKLLEDSNWAEHHCQCPVGLRSLTPGGPTVPDGPIGCDGCICEDVIAPLREILSKHNSVIDGNFPHMPASKR